MGWGRKSVEKGLNETESGVTHITDSGVSLEEKLLFRSMNQSRGVIQVCPFTSDGAKKKIKYLWNSNLNQKLIPEFYT